jgi:salicylate hydroxylase
MALEDAYVLSNLLGLCKSASDLSSAFKAYDAVRIPRTHGVIRESHEQGHILDLEGKGVGDNVEILTEKLNTRVRWIWDEDLEKHLESAVAIFKDDKIVDGVEMMNVKNQASLTVSEVVVV